MTRIVPIVTAFLLGAATGAYAQNAASAADKKFAMDAAGGGMAEVKLGQLAHDKGSSDFVKQFGQKMVDDHGKANDDLKTVAQKNNLTLPSDLPAKDQALYDRLNGMSGTQFDTAYIAAMTKDHEMDVSAFKREANVGKNSDLKEFASKTLPVVQSHLKMLKSKQMM